MLNSKTDKSAVGFYFPNQDSSFTDSLKESLEQVEETTNFNPIQDFKGLVSDDVAFESYKGFLFDDVLGNSEGGIS